MSEEEYVGYVIQYSDMVLRIAVNYCKELPDAEDMVQDVFLKLFESRSRFADEEHARRWLIRVTVNLCKNHLKSAWRRRTQLVEQEKMESVFEQAPCGCTAEAGGDGGEDALFEAVVSLPEKYRSVVHLYYYEDYSVKEIAQILQRKETTIQTRLMRARKMLKQKLKGAWQDEECE